jgi:2-desacetyl-2-hydroxyethyl bacteriochlorophyllide A dehydrogenase
MRAAVTLRAGETPELREVPDPTPGPGEVVVRVRAVGLCGTDLKVMNGAIPTVTFPRIQGHEVAGEIVHGADGVEEGQRVAVHILQPCGTCRWCRMGETTVCPELTRMGFERDGGLAEYVVARAANVIPFSDGLSFDEAAVTMDAVLSPWRALHTKGNVGPGQTVLIVGAGGLGLHAVQIAVAAGATVGVVDLDEARLAQARKLGAELATSPEHRADLDAWAGQGVDLALEASGALPGFRTATELIRPGGTVVTCGYRPGADVSTDSMRLAMDELNIRGSRGGTLADATAALQAVERGEISPLIADSGTLDDLDRFFAQLAAAEALGRLMIHPDQVTA